MKELSCRWLYAFSVMGALIAARGVTAMQNEPGDFRGVPWGAPLEEHRSGLALMSGDDQLAHYRRVPDTNTFAHIDTWRISYRFDKNRFSSAMVTIVGINNFNSMLSHLTKTYGQPDSVSPRHRIYTWAGENAGIMTSCDISLSCYIEFYGKQMRDLEIAEQGEAPSRIKKDD